ncbi:MAG: SIMPL domain-containing protein, partial [Alphaproteobacteria bacterium]|nr:SIMPL domain-containing protein [Alphaproteobacteria bacterium]
AGLYAAAAGLSVGQILSISEGSAVQPGGLPPQIGALSEATPIAEGETKLTATVTLRVSLE